ncbi:monofunctional biosynthetic peptidoglycan transglycosylase [Tepidamorphus sp. 3E244]|uniref:monofunctional biosynthetic peptidoglycan transglycosylase n=1 Tax=Tepidamorphus sp. 3E244 TaxID=3385498 RepID=UPI0038FC80F1
MTGKPHDFEEQERGWFRRALRVVLYAVLALVLLPLVLVPVYALLNPPLSTLMLGDLLTGKSYERQWVALDDMAPVLSHSVIVSEDAKFCVHRGVDWDAVQVAIDQYNAGKEPRGASTIAMQAAKNLFLWPQRSYVRKAIEVPLAHYMDLVWSKRRLIEIYLNTVEWGDGVYGAEAASQHYFKKSAASLTRRQAALLATALPLPVERNPANPSRKHARLARIVEKRARQAGQWVACLERGA